MQKISHIFQYGQVVILYTYASTDKIHGRDMTVLIRPQDEDSIWFSTYTNSRKVKEIKQNNNVIIHYKDPFKREKLILFGKIEIFDDLKIKKELWRDSLQMFYPEGPESKNMVLLKFSPNRNEFLPDN